MIQEKGRKIIVVGHRNPDTDSICSAISYARLKQALTGNEHVACRAGVVNPETQYVLEKFNIPVPELIEDVRTQVKDIEIRKTKGVRSNISLKKAWSLMKELGVVTLPITRDNHLEGLITIGDIANSYMNVYDSAILSAACTQYVNIKETLEGIVIVGDENAYFDKGKVLVAAANPDLMESYIEEHDLVILGNRYESQLCAIEMNAGCIVVCDGAPVSMTIKKLAEEHQCTVISTPFDTFTASRLINQSMPIGYFMKTKDIISFDIEDYTDDIKDVMASKRHRDFPILDKDGHYKGMISRRNLLGMKRKQVILVDHNERAQAVAGIESAEILEIIDHHRLGSLETISPVFFRNQPLGCTGTIIYQMYRESGAEIGPEVAGLLCSAIVSDTLLYRSPTCTEVDRQAAETLASIAGIDTKQLAREMFAAGSDLKQKTEKDIFYQDYKVFDMDGTTVGISQISSMDEEELEDLRGRMIPFLEQMKAKHKVDLLFFMLTSILDESTEVLCDSISGGQLLEQAFPGCRPQNQAVVLPGVVSRKKQFVPALMMVLQG
ncbi:putative manganese-dependent inorganic diphosphatase [Fusibacillus kribbianus]|uniref:inorganic diphosphatase n=1 Tax=Fusibacillus kribbianus TaxID=3044208 RepID=A0AAP4BAK8_9FIRM|nr:putative manganese-dependent inorganic diphosphatase [Ruminococcus sp. YH-rum2234]MDI9241942.1 putative manganese-dependent inorganic diphosphatase [Ruminococcus sp. YH-rum2234]